VKQGDITRESTDAIVNSSNAQLQLDRGEHIFSLAGVAGLQSVTI